ncbi:MAG: PD-(D/E)XK nuclease family protein [Candidatus Thermoplasmatota archaeon]|nr:PD-(D/E)XK nuclease family protein [Candidatus Thermoplasmatota archaeon]
MKETYSPSRLGKALVCPARLRPYRDPPAAQEIHLRSGHGIGLFLHNLLEMWLKKLNVSIKLNPEKFLTMGDYLRSVNDWRGEFASQNIHVHGKISEVISEFRSKTYVDEFLRILHKKESIISIWTEKTISDDMFDQHMIKDFYVKGTVDCLIETDKYLYLIDWKLNIDPQSQLFDCYILQLGLYHELLKLSEPHKQIKLLLVSLTQSDERFGYPLPVMINTEKIVNEFSKINNGEWINWVQSGKKVPTMQCSFCEYNYSTTEFCLERSNDPTIIQNLMLLFGTDPIADFFDVEIPLSNVRRISATKYEITHEHKKVEIVFKNPFYLEAYARKFLRCTGQLRSQNGILSFFIHRHIVFPV